jgi:hypothetical protein
MRVRKRTQRSLRDVRSFWQGVGKEAFLAGKPLTEVLVPGNKELNKVIKAGYRTALNSR